MSSTLALQIVRVFTNILYYFLIIVTLFFAGASVVGYIIGDRDGQIAEWNSGSQFKKVNSEKLPFTYQADSLSKFRMENDRVTVHFKHNSAAGIYKFFRNLLFLLLGVAALFQLKKLFTKKNIEDPFHQQIIKRLRTFATLLIVADVIRIVDYFVMNSLVRNALPTEKLQLVTEIGDGFITALIVLIIMAVLQRGKELREENALTV